MVNAQLRCLGVLLVMLSAVTAVIGSTSEAGATTDPLDVAPQGFAGPILSGAACTNARDGVLLVTGEQLTPGGEVQVVLYRAGSSHPALIRFVRASEPIFGAEWRGRTYPGIHPRRLHRYSFGARCDETAVVRAFDRAEAGIWTNQVSVKLDCEPAL